MVRDNPFVVADLLSARPTRVRRDDSEAGIGSRDGQASPQPGQFLDRNLVVGGGEGEDVVQGPVWQTNKIPLPGFGAERHAAPGALEGEKIPVEKAPEPAKLDPVVSEALTTPVSKSSGNVAEGNDDPHHIPAVRKNTVTQRHSSKCSTSGLHSGCEHSSHSRTVQNSHTTCPLRGPHCGCRLPTRGCHGQTCKLQAEHDACPVYLSLGHYLPVHQHPIKQQFGCAGYCGHGRIEHDASPVCLTLGQYPPVHQCPIKQQSGCTGYCGHGRTEQPQAVLWAQIPLYGTPGGCGCMCSLAEHGIVYYCTNEGIQFVEPGQCRCHFRECPGGSVRE